MFREDTTVYAGRNVYDMIVGAGGPTPSLNWSFVGRAAQRRRRRATRPGLSVSPRRARGSLAKGRKAHRLLPFRFVLTDCQWPSRPTSTNRSPKRSSPPTAVRRRGKIEQHRLALLHRHRPASGEMFEIGPGHGTLAEQAVEAGWRYTAIEASPILVDVLRKKGLAVIESWTPPIPIPDASADVVYADQVLEHMSGIDAARQFTAEAFRALRPGGIFFVVVPDYLKERTFFWDVDYTHNFVTTERRVQAAVQRQRLRHSAHRAQHRGRDRGGARRAGGRRAARQPSRASTRSRATPAPKTCCSRSARISSRR